jgi:hypothetical protein
MSIAAEKLPLPRRDVRKKKLPRRCRDEFLKNLPLPRRYPRPRRRRGSAAMDISEMYLDKM